MRGSLERHNLHWKPYFGGCDLAPVLAWVVEKVECFDLVIGCRDLLSLKEAGREGVVEVLGSVSAERVDEALFFDTKGSSLKTLLKC